MDKKLYDKVINEGIALTTKELKLLGYNARTINKLIDLEMINRVKRGHYKFINVKALFDYGYNSLRGDKELYRRCLLRCLEIEQNNQLVVYSLFYLEVYAGDYEKAVEYLRILIDGNNKNFQKDYNCYLFLLSFLVDLPEEYQKLVDKMEVQDLLVDGNDKRYKDKKKMNEIRTAIFSGKWAYASKNLYVIKTGLAVDFVINRLLRVIQVRLNDTLRNLWRCGKYQEFIELLKLKQDRYSLGRLEYTYLYLAKAYVDIMETKVIPRKKEVENGTIFDYINANDFDKALEIETSQNGNVLSMLLKDICNLIKSMQKSENNVAVQADLFTSLFKALLNGNMILAKRILKRYLQDIHKEEYWAFVFNHIKLCQLEEDFSFVKPMSLLVQLKNNTFSEDLKYYEDLLQDYMKENNEDAVKLVTEMIDFLKGNYKEKVEIVESKQGRKDSYLQIKYNELIRDKGLVLLDPMELSERERIIEQLRSLSDILWFTIGEKEPKRLVLHYVPELKEYIDAKTIVSNLKYKYNKKKYREVIADCLQLLRLKKIKAYTCFRIGASYGHVGEYQKAIDYLIIAQELSKKERDVPFDFTDLIEVIRNVAYQKNEAIKLFANVEFQEFEKHDVDNEFVTIKEAVLIAGHDARSICYYLGYDENQIAQVFLLLARECFMDGNVRRGDNYIKEFEKMPGKSKENMALALEIIRNKKLYINGGATLVRVRSNVNENNGI